MKDFLISTDSTASLPAEFIKENNITVHPLHYIIDGTEYGTDIGLELSDKEFYDSIRNGKMPTTSATNPGFIDKTFREQVNAGYDVLHIGFSSGLSSSYSNAAMCARDIMDEIPGSKIVVIDSLSAECGHALLVYYAVKLKYMGKSIDEIATWIEENKLNVVHHFTLGDLFHLVRGGRLSKTSAIMGSALNIQPILHVDNEGKLANISKARGRKKAIKTLFETIETNTEGFEKEVFFISHSDCEEEAKELAHMLVMKYTEATIWILPISPTVGSHTGVDTIVVSYLGNNR